MAHPYAAGRSTRPMERTTTASSFASTSASVAPPDGTPVATASFANRRADPRAGIYQTCVDLRERMERVPGFAEQFFHPKVPFNPDPSAIEPEFKPNDPVSTMIHVLRFGSSLCYLFNALGLQKQIPIKLEETKNDKKQCKHHVFLFIQACTKELSGLSTEGGGLFMISDLYNNDTNGHMKALNYMKSLVDLLEQRGILMEPRDNAGDTQSREPLNARAQVVREILDSERKYVQDLEVLQKYREDCVESGIPQEVVHNIFMNLNKLLDFQRNFLICIEEWVKKPPHEQRFGHAFMSNEERFAVYEPYCANFMTASEVAMTETPNLIAVGELTRELPAFLIKPVQRICKYPLLMESLVKATEPTAQWYREDCEGTACIKRVTERVNEVKRQHENDVAVQQLKNRVEDWKGHNIDHFGSLLLEGAFKVIKSDTEREYHIYLFERILLCCKEVGMPGGKKGSKSNSILKKPVSKRNTSLQLKGRIFVSNIHSAAPTASRESGPSQYVLKITWRGDLVEEFFSIKCRTADNLREWQTAITRAVEDQGRPRSRAQGPMSAGGLRRGMASAFPSTPMSEMSGAPSLFSGGGSEYAPSLYSTRSRSNLNGEDDFGEATEVYGGPKGGRITPSSRRGPGTQSLPLADRGHDPNNARPRAQTEDSSSAVIKDWRSQMPAGTPSMPPRSSTPSMTASNTTASTENLPSLRNSTSSRGLRSKQSHEWGSAGFGRQPTTSGAYEPELNQISRNASTPVVPLQRTSVTAKPPLLRSRSASSPQNYQGPPGMGQNGSQQSWGEREPPVPSVPPLNVKHQTNGNGLKRFSSSSNSTDRSSGDSSQSQGQSYSSSTSPASTIPGSVPGSARGFPLGLPAKPNQPGQYAVKVKVWHQGDTFVVAVLKTVTYAELADKVLNKLRLCSKLESETLRLRYVDEDDDKILIRDDDDVVMAFESVRANATSGGPTLLLYAD